MEFMYNYILWVIDIAKAFVDTGFWVMFVVPVIFAFVVGVPLSILHIRNEL